MIDTAKADAVEVEFNGGERSATRFANSNIITNMVQLDRSAAITVYQANKSGTATVRDRSSERSESRFDWLVQAVSTQMSRRASLGSLDRWTVAGWICPDYR